MNASIEQLEDKFLVTLEGELDTAAAAEVEETLQPLFNSSGKDVVIDCTELEYIASSGWRQQGHHQESERRHQGGLQADGIHQLI